MNDGINLLINQQQGQQQSKSAPLVRNLSLILLLCVLAISASVFALTVASPLHSLEDKENGLISSLKQYDTQLSQIDVIHDRVQNINKVLQSRKHYDSIISSIQDNTPPTASVDTVETDNKKMSATIKSNNLDDMNTFLNNIQVLNQNKKLFSSITLTELSFTNTTNTYSLTVDLGTL